MGTGKHPNASESVEAWIVQQLSSHWVSSSTASDDLAGIHRWWLSESPHVTQDQVERALAWMVREGLIEARGTPDQRVRYRRRPDASAEEFERLAGRRN